MKEVEVKGIGLVKNWGLSESDMNKLGKQSKCLCCSNPFVVGASEISSKLVDEKGKPKQKVEVCMITDVEDKAWEEYLDYLWRGYLEDVREGIIQVDKKELNAIRNDKTKLLPDNPEDWYFFKDVKVKDIPANLPLSVQAIVVGVSAVNSRVCPVCSTKNSTKSEVGWDGWDDEEIV